MLENLKISCIQSELAWENINENLNRFTEKINGLSANTEIVILPEMFTTGFSMNSEKLSEKMNGKTFVWMKEQAKKSNKLIIGSWIITEGRKYYNRLFAMFPNGDYSTYDKRHLFRMGKEDEHFTSGKEKLVFKHKGWRICPLICYDLRFPVWSRNRNDYDLLIYIANWPATRREVWKSLLIARAIENQAYVIGVNRIGEDGTGLTYSGDTLVVSPKGEIKGSAKQYNEDNVETELSLDDLKSFREKFPAWMDADDFEII